MFDISNVVFRSTIYLRPLHWTQTGWLLRHRGLLTLSFHIRSFVFEFEQFDNGELKMIDL